MTDGEVVGRTVVINMLTGHDIEGVVQRTPSRHNDCWVIWDGSHTYFVKNFAYLYVVNAL